MKLLKLVFSKYFLSALALLIQVSLLVFFIAVFNEFFALFQLINVVIGVRIFYAIVNKEENPQYKTPWLFLVLFLPIFGVTFYILFGRPKVTKKEAKFFREITDKIFPFMEEAENNKRDVSNVLGRWNGINNYLRNNSKMNGTLGNEIKYYPLGELLWEDLLTELKKAKKYIFMEYFIIDPGIMWDSIHEILAEKVKEGVEVRLLYDDVGCMTMLHSGYYKKLRKEGIQCYKFNKLLPFVSGIYNNRDHRKITVIDGEVGFTGGINLGDEYINRNDRLGHWKDTGIRIKGNAVKNLLCMFLIAYDVQSRRVSDYGDYFVKEYKSYSDKGYANPFGDGPKPYYNEQVGENNYVNLINEAKDYVWITTPYLIIDYNLLSALKNAASKGVDVRIVTPHIPDKKLVLNMTRSHYKPLMDSGVTIYEYTPGFIHAKMLIADGEIAFVGTINLDYRSLTHHYECGTVIFGQDCITEIESDFKHIFEISEAIPKDFRLKWPARFMNKLLKVFEPMF